MNCVLVDIVERELLPAALSNFAPHTSGFFREVCGETLPKDLRLRIAPLVESHFLRKGPVEETGHVIFDQWRITTHAAQIQTRLQFALTTSPQMGRELFGFCGAYFYGLSKREVSLLRWYRKGEGCCGALERETRNFLHDLWQRGCDKARAILIENGSPQSLCVIQCSPAGSEVKFQNWTYFDPRLGLVHSAEPSRL